MPSQNALAITFRGPRLMYVDHDGRIREVWLSALDLPHVFLRAVCRVCPLAWVTA